MNHRLKIAQVSPYYYPSLGGVEKVVQMVSESLVKRGHHVNVITSFRIHGRKTPARPTANESIRGVRVTRLKSLVELGHMSVLPGIIPLIGSGRFDIVHNHVYRHPNNELALWAARIRALPTVLTGHGPFFSSEVSGRSKYLLYRTYDRTLGPLFLRRTNRVIALTRFEREVYRGLGCRPEKIEIIPNPVEEECFDQADPTDFLNEHGLKGKRLILFLGSLCRSKRPDLLMDALPAIVEQVPDATALFVGPDEGEGTALEQRGKQLGVADHYRCLGALTGMTKHQALAAADLLVLPSDGESFGIVIAEAMAHGKPVVATDAVGPREIVVSGTTGYIVSRQRPDQLAKAVLEILGKPEKARHMGVEAKRIAEERYHIQKVVDRIEKLYYELIG